MLAALACRQWAPPEALYQEFIGKEVKSWETQDLETKCFFLGIQNVSPEKELRASYFNPENCAAQI